MSKNDDQPLTVARLRIATVDGQPVARPPSPAKPRRLTRDDLYILIRLRQFHRVARLPGKAYAVFSVIMFETRTQKTRTIELGNAELHKSGIYGDAKRWALRALERAGVIAVQYPPGRNPLVTLLDEPAAD
jgi:hypothetical protein